MSGTSPPRLRLEAPFLDLRLPGNRPFTAVLTVLVFAGIAMAGTGLLVTQYLQNVLGHSPAAPAVLFAPMGPGVAAAPLRGNVIAAGSAGSRRGRARRGVAPIGASGQVARVYQPGVDAPEPQLPEQNRRR